MFVLAGGALFLIGIIVAKQVNPYFCGGLGENPKVPSEDNCICSFTVPLPVDVTYPTNLRPCGHKAPRAVTTLAYSCMMLCSLLCLSFCMLHSLVFFLFFWLWIFRNGSQLDKESEFKLMIFPV
jgi:hypothetical protein